MKPANTAVAARRYVPTDSLDLYSTPPWSTRALLVHVLPKLRYPGCRHLDYMKVWEPCAGLRHMADVLAEGFERVYATDVFDYGGLDAIGSFVGEGPDVLDKLRPDIDWIITNPPFVKAAEVVLRALSLANVGVAMLLRTQWIETKERYEIFREFPPSLIAVFSGRVPMVQGRWDPEASSATSYSWFVWVKDECGAWPVNLTEGVDHLRTMLIPPTAETELWRHDDVARFALRGVLDEGPGPLFG